MSFKICCNFGTYMQTYLLGKPFVMTRSFIFATAIVNVLLKVITNFKNLIYIPNSKILWNQIEFVHVNLYYILCNFLFFFMWFFFLIGFAWSWRRQSIWHANTLRPFGQRKSQYIYNIDIIFIIPINLKWIIKS